MKDGRETGADRAGPSRLASGCDDSRFTAVPPFGNFNTADDLVADTHAGRHRRTLPMKHLTRSVQLRLAVPLLTTSRNRPNKVHLTPTECQLPQALAGHPGRLVSQRHLLQKSGARPMSNRPTIEQAPAICGPPRESHGARTRLHHSESPTAIATSNPPAPANHDAMSTCFFTTVTWLGRSPSASCSWSALSAL